MRGAFMRGAYMQGAFIRDSTVCYERFPAYWYGILVIFS